MAQSRDGVKPASMIERSRSDSKIDIAHAGHRGSSPIWSRIERFGQKPMRICGARTSADRVLLSSAVGRPAIRHAPASSETDGERL